MQVSATVDLTEKEVRFVHELASGRAPTRAAREAGYAVSYARNLLLRPDIRAALLAVHQNTGQILDKLAKREGSVGEVEPGA